MKFRNFGELIRHINRKVLDPATVDVEKDDLTITFYESEVSFVINELYNGSAVVFKVKDKKGEDISITLEINENVNELDFHEFNQLHRLADLLNDNKGIILEAMGYGELKE